MCWPPAQLVKAVSKYSTERANKCKRHRFVRDATTNHTLNNTSSSKVLHYAVNALAFGKLLPLLAFSELL